MNQARAEQRKEDSLGSKGRCKGHLCSALEMSLTYRVLTSPFLTPLPQNTQKMAGPPWRESLSFSWVKLTLLEGISSTNRGNKEIWRHAGGQKTVLPVVAQKQSDWRAATGGALSPPLCSTARTLQAAAQAAASAGLHLCLASWSLTVQ